MAPYCMGFPKGKNLCLISYLLVLCNLWPCFVVALLLVFMHDFCEIRNVYLIVLCQLVGANGQPNVGKKVRLQLYQPPNKSITANDAVPQVCSYMLIHVTL